VIAIILILLITVLTVAHFYLKCSVITAFSTFMSAIFGSIIAFNYYELLADLFVSRGYGGPWAHAGCFILAFVLGFAAVRALADLLVGANIDFGNTPKITVNVILGLVTGLILSGHLLVAFGMLPVSGGWAYNRFPPGSPISLNNPKTVLLNPDGMVSSIFSLFSKGSLSSSKSFGVLCADFVNRNHLNRHGTKDGIWTVSSRKALSVPPASKKPVRTMDIPDVGNVTVARAILAFRDIPDGGAKQPPDGNIIFTMSQVRMITKASDKAGNLSGAGKAIWPIGILEKGKLVKKSLSDTMTYTNKEARKDRTVWVDFVFETPASQQGVLLEFKLNAITQLPSPAVSNDELENALNAAEEQPAENGTEQAPAQPAENPQ